MLYCRCSWFSRRLRILMLLLIICLTLVIENLSSEHGHSPWSVLSGRPSLFASVVRRKWQPPFDWTGESIVYDNFGSLNERYGFGVHDLKKSTWAFRRPVSSDPQPTGHDTTSKSISSRISCLGPRRLVLNESETDAVTRHFGQLKTFPEPVLGSSRLVGFGSNVCYDRHGRYGAYGLDSSDVRHHTNDLNHKVESVNWQNIDWAKIQRQCLERNKHRFNHTARIQFSVPPRLTAVASDINEQHIARTAVVIRSHQDQIYTEEVKRTIRSIIQELAVHAGAEYAVFLFVHVKDVSRAIFEDSTNYRQALVDFVPAEFRSISVLWSSDNWHSRYPKIPKDYLNVHLSQWLPMQYFQRLYPEFDYYWNWEMDVRFTGHYHDFVQAVDIFSALQPRKGLWERNERFYIPRLHGSYHDFRLKTQQRYTNRDDTQDSSIWGPHFPDGKPTAEQHMRTLELNTTPPVASPAQDDYEWGVGESADFLSFLPMFNPDPTPYVYHDGYQNYDDALASNRVFRRTSIITFSRLSSRLLRLMEMENQDEPMHHMSSETWPHSIALHYGLKAVSVPHGIYMEQDWPLEGLDFIFNNGDQKWTLTHHPLRDKMNPRGEGSGGPESTFGWGREHNWIRTTWYYQNRFAERLYKRWLGWEYDGIGGPQWEKKHGPYCLPPMLLHPIKVMIDPDHEGHLSSLSESQHSRSSW